MLNAQGMRAVVTVRRSATFVGALALALTGGLVATSAAKRSGEPVKLTQVLFQTVSSGTPPVSGSNAAVGTSDGHIGKATVHGTVRGRNKYPAFTGTWIMFDSRGAIDFSLKGHVIAPGSFAGTGVVTGGMGMYRRASGKLTFTAHTQTPTAGQSSPVIVRRLSGRLFLP